jgi:hypothetical protein
MDTFADVYQDFKKHFVLQTVKERSLPFSRKVTASDAVNLV